MIKSAALKLPDGRIYVGESHAKIILQEPIGVLRNVKQGFITDDGRFVDRTEGRKIAVHNNQIKTKYGNPNELYSEDLK